MRTSKIILLFISTLFCVSFNSAEENPTIFLCGDSTMADKLPSDSPETGWGTPFKKYFTDGIEIQNHAVNGRSTKSFRTEGRWAKVISQVKKGDWVFIQFGHNDQKVADTIRSAPAQTDYRRNLSRFIEEVQAKGGNTLLITPVNRRKFDENGKFIDQHKDYPTVLKEVAKQYNVPMLDLHSKSFSIIEKHGVEGSKKLFMHYGGGIFKKFPDGIKDDTHFSPYGAEIMASAVAEGIVELGLPIRNYLKKSVYPNKMVYELPKIYQPFFRKDTFNIVRYGAKPDGITLNTNSIQQTIDLCSQSGGGTVLIPQGLWLTGPIILKSNVNLHLKKGALLQFSDNKDDFPMVITSWEGQESVRCQSPISAANAENIGITGEGVIDGAGQVWRMVKKEKLTDSQWKNLLASGGVLDESKKVWYPSAGALKGNNTPKAGILSAGFNLENSKEFKDFLRPNMVRFTQCKYILLEGVTFQNSPAWNIHPMLCDHITLRNIFAKNPWYAQNGDGLDLESCRNGIVENCNFDVGDDAICIKSGRDEEGRKRGVPTENFIVKDCIVHHGHGGFVIGSEMSGGVRNLFVNNCTFLGTDVGLRFKTARGRGGIVENIYVSDIQMNNIPGEAILFDMYYMAKDPVPQAGEKFELPIMEFKKLDESTPQFQNFYIKNVVCKGAETAILVRGLPEMSIKNISIEDISIQSNKGFICMEGENISLKNVNLQAKESVTMQVNNSKNITLDNIQYPSNTETLLKISGERNQNIRMINTNTKLAKNDVEFGAKTDKKVFSRK